MCRVLGSDQNTPTLIRTMLDRLEPQETQLGRREEMYCLKGGGGAVEGTVMSLIGCPLG